MQLSARWRALPQDEKDLYLQKEAVDRKRFKEESAQADAEALRIQEERRAQQEVQEGESTSARGARKKMDLERMEQQERQANRIKKPLSTEAQARRDQAQAETEKRRKARQVQEDALAKQHRKLDKEEARKASQRLEYLLAQSDVFAKLKSGGDAKNGKQVTEEKKEEEPKKRDRRSGAHRSEVKEVEEEEEEEVGDNHIFLSQQPACIKFGTLKPYQMESLNWMIHLAEKGLNGILADGTF